MPKVHAGTFGNENRGKVSLTVPVLDRGEHPARSVTHLPAILREKTAVSPTKTVAGGAPGPAAGVVSGGEETDGEAGQDFLGWGGVKMSLFADLRHFFANLRHLFPRKRLCL